MNDSIFDQFPLLQTKRLVLREPRLSDAEAHYRIFTDSRTLTYLGRDPMASLTEAQEKLLRWIGDYEKKDGIRWVLEEKATGRYVGSAGFWRLIRPHFRAEIGYETDPECWNCGYMTEALQTIIPFGFETIGLHSVEGNIHPENIGSRRILEKLGFVQEGYYKEHYFFDGEFSDTASFSLLSPLRFQA